MPQAVEPAVAIALSLAVAEPGCRQRTRVNTSLLAPPALKNQTMMVLLADPQSTSPAAKPIDRPLSPLTRGD